MSSLKPMFPKSKANLSKEKEIEAEKAKLKREEDIKKKVESTKTTTDLSKLAALALDAEKATLSAKAHAETNAKLVKKAVELEKNRRKMGELAEIQLKAMEKLELNSIDGLFEHQLNIDKTRIEREKVEQKEREERKKAELKRLREEEAQRVLEVKEKEQRRALKVEKELEAIRKNEEQEALMQKKKEECRLLELKEIKAEVEAQFRRKIESLEHSLKMAKITEEELVSKLGFAQTKEADLHKEFDILKEFHDKEKVVLKAESENKISGFEDYYKELYSKQIAQLELTIDQQAAQIIQFEANLGNSQDECKNLRSENTELRRRNEDLTNLVSIRAFAENKKRDDQDPDSSSSECLRSENKIELFQRVSEDNVYPSIEDLGSKAIRFSEFSGHRSIESLDSQTHVSFDSTSDITIDPNSNIIVNSGFKFANDASFNFPNDLSSNFSKDSSPISPNDPNSNITIDLASKVNNDPKTNFPNDSNSNFSNDSSPSSSNDLNFNFSNNSNSNLSSKDKIEQLIQKVSNFQINKTTGSPYRETFDLLIKTMFESLLEITQEHLRQERITLEDNSGLEKLDGEFFKQSLNLKVSKQEFEANVDHLNSALEKAKIQLDDQFAIFLQQGVRIAELRADMSEFVSVSKWIEKIVNMEQDFFATSKQIETHFVQQDEERSSLVQTLQIEKKKRVLLKKKVSKTKTGLKAINNLVETLIREIQDLKSENTLIRSENSAIQQTLLELTKTELSPFTVLDNMEKFKKLQREILSQVECKSSIKEQVLMEIMPKFNYIEGKCNNTLECATNLLNLQRGPILEEQEERRQIQSSRQFTAAEKRIATSELDQAWARAFKDSLLNKDWYISRGKINPLEVINDDTGMTDVEWSLQRNWNKQLITQRQRAQKLPMKWFQ